MMETETALHQQISSGYRDLQPQVSHSVHLQQHGQPHPSHQNLESQSGLDLSGLVDNDAAFPQDLQRLQNASHVQVFHTANAFDNNHGRRHMHHQATGSPHALQQHQSHHQFPILTPNSIQHNSIAKLQQGEDIFGNPDRSDQQNNGHLSTRTVPDPPNLDEWRKKLFDVDEMITLSQDQFETYFAHVDNVYSHRSTQRYKRKPFISHYFDCRLKGRPSGTPKSEDPNKKKRKRTARERDLCDVKIKITEYFPGAMLRPDFVPDGEQNGDGQQRSGEYYSSSSAGGLHFQNPQRSYGLTINGVAQNHPGSTGERFYTIQRVNGNGGNGKGDGVAGPHKHTLEESDRVKKNSVQRFLMKRDKEERMTMKSFTRRASGAALTTIRRHSKDTDLKLFGTCCSPFAQRVWIALETLCIPYQYIEVDPYKKPVALLEIDSNGHVPTLRHGAWGCRDSAVLVEYLDDLSGPAENLLPKNLKDKARCKQWATYIDRHIVPAFYALLASPLPSPSPAHAKLQSCIITLVEAAASDGPFFMNDRLGFVDVMFAPWIVRCNRMLKRFRDWPDPEQGSRWERWMQAVEADERIQATCSGEEVYEDAVARWTQGKTGQGDLGLRWGELEEHGGGYELP